MCYTLILDNKRAEIKVLNEELEKFIVEYIELSEVYQKDKDKRVKKVKEMQLIIENSKAQ